MLDYFLAVTVPQALSSLSPLSILVIFLAGILTSVTPCVLAMLPVMVGYIGGGQHPSRGRGFLLSACFVLGLATTFALMGLLAVSLGQIFGQVGAAWYYAVAAVCILMGLNLLEILPLRFPALKRLPPRLNGFGGAFLLGMVFGVVASPCTTPVLVAVLAMVSASGEIYYGAALLFVYGLGHGMPLLAAGTFAAGLKQLARLRAWTRWINYFSGGLLILAGLYFLYLVNS